MRDGETEDMERWRAAEVERSRDGERETASEREKAEHTKALLLSIECGSVNCTSGLIKQVQAL
ncbi:unnamed protein product [Acanthoscelides obtectus]|uniref:Uncharacterized protein n=1 Tax=Acanthoscelides obtectus TaxID=200917 RepID=A0A9P0LER1_ACAOB|nr:unnamed protein product [Acanthoscelides obtectus]CAK1635934.1 hypothetical protein AOBTE_LOCUS9637 [Acanthoscelides obtectus]